MKSNTKGLLIAGVSVVALIVYFIIRPKKSEKTAEYKKSEDIFVPSEKIEEVTQNPVWNEEDKNVNSAYCRDSWCACVGSNPLGLKGLACVACGKAKNMSISDFENEIREEMGVSPC